MLGSTARRFSGSRQRRSLVLLSALVCGIATGATARNQGGHMKIESSAFGPMKAIPAKHTCEGDDVSPPLAWSGLPEGTKTLALIIDDPDAPDPKAPRRVWVHWVLFNIPAVAVGLDENATQLPLGTRVGVNDWKNAKYQGPCPPIGKHRYFHKLYALDTPIELDRPTKKELEAAMVGHILGTAELVGTYEKTKK